MLPIFCVLPLARSEPAEMENIEHMMRTLPEGDVRRDTLEGEYEYINLPTYEIIGGDYNILKAIFAKFRTLTLQDMKQKKKEFTAYKRPVRPARFSIGRSSLGGGPARNFRRAAVNVRAIQNHESNAESEGEHEGAGPSQVQTSTSRQTTARGNDDRAAWEEKLKADFTTLKKNFMSKNPTARDKKPFVMRKDPQKKATAKVVYYRVDCFVEHCGFVLSARVGYLPGKNHNGLASDVESMRKHILGQHTLALIMQKFM
jgi:hypothetical protein